MDLKSEVLPGGCSQAVGTPGTTPCSWGGPLGTGQVPSSVLGHTAGVLFLKNTNSWNYVKYVKINGQRDGELLAVGVAPKAGLAASCGELRQSWTGPFGSQIVSGFMVVLLVASAGLGFCGPRALQATFHPAHLRNWLTKEKNEAQHWIRGWCTDALGPDPACLRPSSPCGRGQKYSEYSKVWPRLLSLFSFMKGLGLDHSWASVLMISYDNTWDTWDQIQSRPLCSHLGAGQWPPHRMDGEYWRTSPRWWCMSWTRPTAWQMTLVPNAKHGCPTKRTIQNFNELDNFTSILERSWGRWHLASRTGWMKQYGMEGSASQTFLGCNRRMWAFFGRWFFLLLQSFMFRVYFLIYSIRQ